MSGQYKQIESEEQPIPEFPGLIPLLAAKENRPLYWAATLFAAAIIVVKSPIMDALAQ